MTDKCRLITWYSIITVIFRCPTSPDLLNDTSPKICKPYFQVKSTLAPYVVPHYDTFVAPHVDSVKPYYNILDKNVITPAAFYGKKYGAPRVAQAQAFGKAHWEKRIQPQVSKLHAVALQQYNKTLAPHIQSVSAATGPYAKFAKDNALQTYYASILPAYTALQPYAQHAYTLGSNFTVDTGIPYAKWALDSGIVFLDRTVWPKVKILYGENVEPQLVRIGERLGRYRDGKRLKAIIEEVDVSSSASSVSSTSSSISSSVESAHTTSVYSTSSVTTPSPSVSSTNAANTPVSEDEQRVIAKKIVADDLKTWQEKFAKAADQGSDELDHRITEITDRAIQKQAQGVGKAHLILLEETVKSEVRSLKRAIISIVKLQYKVDDINSSVRKAGISIRDKAQAVRTWRKSFDRDTNELVAKAAEDTFQIIDHIRDLGLQEIGMRWAWTDGITHKDWAKYHALKNKFDEWRHNVEEVATAHPGLASARAASEDIESRAMAIAEDAAKELSRLKETGKWKLSAGDASDDFTTKRIPAAAAGAAQKVVDNLQEASQAIIGTTQGTAESLGSVASPIAIQAGSSASSSAASIADDIKAYASDASINARSTASSISLSVMGTPQESIEGVPSAAQASASSLGKKASSSVIEISQSVIQSVAPVASDSNSSLVANASTSEKASRIASSAALVASDDSGSSASPAPSVSNKVWGGAEAQHAEAKTTIYEDVIDESENYSEKVQSMVNEAYSAASSVFTPPPAIEAILESAQSRVNDAVDSASIQIYGTPKGNYEQVSSSASSAYRSMSSAASMKIYGSSTGYVEAASSSVAEVASSAHGAIVSAIYGTSTPAYVSATSYLDDAVSSATSVIAENIASATSAVGDTYSSAQDKVSSMAYGPEQGAFESAEARLGAAVQSARVKLSAFAVAASDGANEVAREASEGIEDFASSIGSAVGPDATSAKDEL